MFMVACLLVYIQSMIHLLQTPGFVPDHALFGSDSGVLCF